MVCFEVINKGFMSLLSEMCWHVCYKDNLGIEFKNGSRNISNNILMFISSLLLFPIYKYTYIINYDILRNKESDTGHLLTLTLKWQV